MARDSAIHKLLDCVILLNENPAEQYWFAHDLAGWATHHGISRTHLRLLTGPMDALGKSLAKESPKPIASRPGKNNVVCMITLDIPKPRRKK